MQNEILSLFSRVIIPTASEYPVEDRFVPRFLTECAAYGFMFDTDAEARIRTLSPLDFASFRTTILDLFSDLSGAGVVHTTLFNKFPYDTPDQYDYLRNRVSGFITNLFGLARSNGANVLTCGHAIDPALFDLSQFGACPICQYALDARLGRQEVKFSYKSVTPLRVVSSADHSFVQRKGNELLARNSSLNSTEKDFIKALSRTFALDRPAKIFKENLPFAYEMFGADYVVTQLSGATDVLRLAYFVSDRNSDLSLKENVRFKLTSGAKRDFMAMLESLNNLTEDFMRDRERWLRLGERLNPGTKDNRKRYPKVAVAFDALRNEAKHIETFSRKVERKIRAKVVDGSLVALLERRPGEFVRRIDFLLRNAVGKENVVYEGLRTALPNATTKILFEVRKYLSYRALGEKTDRVFFPKGQVNRVQVVQDRRETIDPTVIQKVTAIIDGVLLERLSGLPEMKKVFVSKGLRDVLIPFNQRGDSKTTSPVVKGSKYPIGNSPVIRLFVHSTGHFDVDLSLIGYDADFRKLMQISFTNLKQYACVHSGDIQSAPNGASEFVDFEIQDLINRGIRYVATSVISFRGQGFDTFPCFAGYMERDALKSGQKYEPNSVKIKFDLNSPNTSHAPLLFDLVNRQVIFADMASGESRYGTVSGDNKKLAAVSKAMLNLTRIKPTAYDVLTMHALARGSLVQSREEADLVFDIDHDPTLIGQEFMA